MTEVDYPPFNYAGPDGNPAGFNVDLARLICEELKIACTIQMRRFDTLVPALDENRGDAVIASIAVTAETRRLARFHRSVLPRARALRGAARAWRAPNLRPEQVEGKKVAVVVGHRARGLSEDACSPRRSRSPISAPRAREALQRGEVDFVFGDGISLAFWLNGTDSGGCCEFAGGPFIESRYFGEGVGIAVKRGNDTLRLAFNWALFRLWEKGRFTRPVAALFPDQPVLRRQFDAGRRGCFKLRPDVNTRR